MRNALWLSTLLVILSACSTTKHVEVDHVPAPTPEQMSAKKSVGVLRSELGMDRDPSDLGFTEKLFNPCSYKMAGESCNDQVITVVHFQLLCRDSEGTVSNVPLHLRPITAPVINWSVAGRTGSTRTDTNGYGQFSLVSKQTLKEKRLILRKGAQYVGLTISEISKIVLPKNWCGRT